MKRLKYYILATLAGIGFIQAQLLSKEEIKQELNQNAKASAERVAAYLLEHPEAANREDTDRYHNIFLSDVVDGIPIYTAAFNAGSNQTLGSNQLHNGGGLGLNLSGAGMSVGVWDGGRALNTHQEFASSRLINLISADLSYHATHVSGTIAAKGINPQAIGIAPASKIFMKTYAISGVYTDIDNTVSNTALNINFSNHSWGLVADNLPDYYFGKYNSSARSTDLIANSNPYHIIVTAAGNDRDNSDLENVANNNGYDLLTSMSCAKNNLTVGAIHQVSNYTGPNSVSIADFSNYGPTDDFRIKPDIVAKGTNVFSTWDTGNTDYATIQGTSMATPAITGLCVLLQEHYENIHGNYMLSSTLRGLMAHAAREAGIANGPDPKFGWGLPDAVKMANIISASNVSNSNNAIIEATLTNFDTYEFQSNGLEPLVVTLAWNDPAGTDNGTTLNDTTPALVNNLNVLVKDAANTSYYPWRLDTTNNFLPAKNDGPNNVDNIEKVEIPNASGNYTVEINVNGSLSGSQDYSLIVSGASLLGVEDVTQNTSQLEIYPNPVQDFISIESTEDLIGAKYSIVNIDGALVRASVLQSNQIDVSSLETGSYVLVIENNNDKKVKTFIKR